MLDSATFAAVILPAGAGALQVDSVILPAILYDFSPSLSVRCWSAALHAATFSALILPAGSSALWGFSVVPPGVLQAFVSDLSLQFRLRNCWNNGMSLGGFLLLVKRGEWSTGAGAASEPRQRSLPHLENSR